MFYQFITPNQPTAAAARDFFLIHPRNVANVADVLSVHFGRYGFSREIPQDLREALRADAATLAEALSVAAGRWLEDEATEAAQDASLARVAPFSD